MQPDMHEIPFFIETNSPELFTTLQRIASRISPRVYKADSYHRRVLHLSAVFACNFVNHLYHVASEIAVKEGLDFDYLRPLILETTHKALLLPPSEAQTGPARREDENVLVAHQRLLQSIAPEYLPLYTLMTESIRKTYHQIENE
jgi:predicted short-subunit dehydrogenase-like oxidoreductase (DUF2520 family)